MIFELEKRPEPSSSELSSPESSSPELSSGRGPKEPKHKKPRGGVRTKQAVALAFDNEGRLYDVVEGVEDRKESGGKPVADTFIASTRILLSAEKVQKTSGAPA